MISRTHTAWLDLALLALSVAILLLLILFPWPNVWPSSSELDDRPIPHLYTRPDLDRAFQRGYAAGRSDAIRSAGWPNSRTKETL